MTTMTADAGSSATFARHAAETATSADAATREYKARRIYPLRALKAYRRLLADKEDTVQVFEIMNALSGMATPNGYLKLTRVAGGVAFEREELSRRFGDAAWLDGFAEGTVGAAYRDFMRQENLTAEGLAKDNRAISPFIDAPHVYAWYGRRVRDIHDVWHILTGYGRDALGETCLVTFSWAQTKNLGFGFIGLASAFQLARKAKGVPAFRAIWEAWRNGRRAAWLPAQDYAALFAEPLDAARQRLKIAAPQTYLGVPKAVRSRLTFSG